jgi:hypothetical protein
VFSWFKVAAFIGSVAFMVAFISSTGISTSCAVPTDRNICKAFVLNALQKQEAGLAEGRKIGRPKNRPGQG